MCAFSGSLSPQYLPSWANYISPIWEWDHDVHSVFITLFFFTWYIVHIFWFHYLFICIFYFLGMWSNYSDRLYHTYMTLTTAHGLLPVCWRDDVSHWPSLGPLKQPSNWCSVSTVHSSEQTLYFWWWHFSASKLPLAPFVYTEKPNTITLSLLVCAPIKPDGLNKHMKRCMCKIFLGIREMQTKPQWGTTSHLLG